MLPALGQFLTPGAPDPEKWKTVQSALETTSKTVRLSVILIVSCLPLLVVAALIVLLARR
jgi:hypothetical protein